MQIADTKPTLKVEFCWKHFIGQKFIQVKKGKGGGTRSLDINRAAQYDKCLSKAQEFFSQLRQANRHG